jgi:hypothetical protein
MNRFDLIVLFLFSGVVENALVGDTSLTGGVIGATLVAANRAAERPARRTATSSSSTERRRSSSRAAR